MSEKVSQGGYAAAGGGACPVCGSGDMDGDLYDGDGACVSQRVHCNACHSTWYDCYELTGYFDLETPAPQSKTE